MKPLVTIGCIDTGHAPYAPGMTVTGNPLFNVNGKPVCCTGDVMTPHVSPIPPPHAGTIIATSKLTINGKPAAMLGDLTTCGATLAQGDPLFNIS